MNLFDAVLQRNRDILKTYIPGEYGAYFRERHNTKLAYDAKSGICTITKADGNSMHFEPLTVAEMFETATAFCKDGNFDNEDESNQ